MPQDNFAPDQNPTRLAGLSSFQEKALQKINEAPTTHNWPARTVLEPSSGTKAPDACHTSLENESVEVQWQDELDGDDTMPGYLHTGGDVLPTEGDLMQTARGMLQTTARGMISGTQDRVPDEEAPEPQKVELEK